MTKPIRGHLLTTDAEIDELIARSKTFVDDRQRAVSAEYIADEDVIAITMESGVRVLIPRSLLQFLELVGPEQLAEVEVDFGGLGLHWESLDVDHYVPALIEGVFGNRRWMSELGKKGGASRSDAKASAARENGKRGGRPKMGRGPT